METAELFNQSLLLHRITLQLYIHRSDPGRQQYWAELAFLGVLTIPRERGIGLISNFGILKKVDNVDTTGSKVYNSQMKLLLLASKMEKSGDSF